MDRRAGLRGLKGISPLRSRTQDRPEEKWESPNLYQVVGLPPCLTASRTRVSGSRRKMESMAGLLSSGSGRVSAGASRSQ